MIQVLIIDFTTVLQKLKLIRFDIFKSGKYPAEINTLSTSVLHSPLYMRQSLKVACLRTFTLTLGFVARSCYKTVTQEQAP